MTFLEWLLTRQIGPATYSRGKGESTWPCPQCGHPRFHTLPHKVQFRDRARCWSCGFRGDAADMLRAFDPDLPWRETMALLDDLRAEYEGKEPLTYSPGVAGGERSLPAICPKCSAKMSGQELEWLVADEEFSARAESAANELLAYMGKAPSAKAFREALLLVQHGLEICAKHGLHPASFAHRVGFEEWTRVMEMEHVEEVGTSLADCDAATCQASRCRSVREARGGARKGVKGVSPKPAPRHHPKRAP